MTRSEGKRSLGKKTENDREGLERIRERSRGNLSFDTLDLRKEKTKLKKRYKKGGHKSARLKKIRKGGKLRWEERNLRLQRTRGKSASAKKKQQGGERNIHRKKKEAKSGRDGKGSDQAKPDEAWSGRAFS